MKNKPKISLVKPRSTVEVHLVDGRVLSGPRGATVGEFLQSFLDKQLFPQAGKFVTDQANKAIIPTTATTIEAPPLVGAIVNSLLHELTFLIQSDAEVQPITISDPDGMRIYHRSLIFLLEVACAAIFPEALLTIDHSVATGGYFCQVLGRSPFTQAELEKLENYMRQLVAEDLPFRRVEVPLAQAHDYFKSIGHDDTVRLLAYRQKDYLTLYYLGNYGDYHHGYLVPSTGCLRWFGLSPSGDGFTFLVPQTHHPTELRPLPDYPKLRSTFRRYGDWLRRLGIANVGSLNDAIYEGRMREVILVSEAFHEQHVAEIAAQVAALADRLRLIFIAGPSSAGKTTFSKRLTVQLLARGISPFALEMDNYFLEREKTPREESGNYDYESLPALDRELLKQDLRRLISLEKVRLPRFNFKDGLREAGEVVQLSPGQMIILEGIHGLNPELLPSFPHEQTFRIYVSALTQLNLDRHNRISTTDSRLLRRIVRDARERGYSAHQTIQRWESVRRGEVRNIFPYQENADVMFNSALVYELAVLKPTVEPLLRQVDYGTPEYIEAKRLLAFLEWFLPLESDLVPDNSILREFIGGSILSEFKVWRNQMYTQQ